MRDFLKIYGPFVALAILGLVVAFRFVEPPPPRQLVIAAGSPGGAYYAFAERYQRLLAESGVDVTIHQTMGAVDNLRLLSDGVADFGIVQGGVSVEADSGSVWSLGGMFHEPLWVFYRDDAGLEGLDGFKTARIAVGPIGSGTRTLTLQLRQEWGGGWGTESSLQLGGGDAADALRAGEIDAAVYVASIEAPYIRELLMTPSISLLPFPRGPALARRNPSVATIDLLRGVVDIEADIPAQTTPLIAPVAQIMVRKDLHPAIQALLLEAASAIHSEGTLLASAGTFPDKDLVDIELSPQARRFYERGPSALRRWFSFGVANFLERAWVLMIPLLTLLIPVVRAAPPIYRWRVRRRIYVWYSDLKVLEERGRAASIGAARDQVLSELGQLQEDVGTIEVPLSYTDDLYRLRNHIRFVEDLLRTLE